MPSIEGRRPSRSPAACRAAPRPIRLAVEPPAVKVPTKPVGKPRRSMSQRIARSSTKFAGVAHRRCGEATAWTRSATVPIVVGAVVTRPLKPVCPIRRPAATISPRRSARVRLGPIPALGSGWSSAASQADRRVAGSSPSNRRNCSSVGRTAARDGVRWVVRAGSGLGGDPPTAPPNCALSSPIVDPPPAHHAGRRMGHVAGLRQPAAASHAPDRQSAVSAVLPASILVG